MNLLESSTSRKKIILISSAVIVTLTMAVLVFLFWDKIKPTEKEQVVEDTPTEPEDVSWTPNRGFTFWQPAEKEELVGKTEVSVLSSNEEAKIVNFDDMSSFGILTGKIGDKSKKYKIQPSSILFDTSMMKSVPYNFLKKDTDIRILSSKGSSLGEGVNTAEAILLGDGEVSFVPVEEVWKADKYLSLVNVTTKDKLIVSNDTVILDAISGKKLKRDDVDSGIKVFYTTRDDVDIELDEEDDSGLEVSIVDALYVYP